MIEQDPHTWWELTCKAIRQVLANSGVDRKMVRGMAVSSQGLSFVLIDRQGESTGERHQLAGWTPGG